MVAVKDFFVLFYQLAFTFISVIILPVRLKAGLCLAPMLGLFKLYFTQYDCSLHATSFCQRFFICFNTVPVTRFEFTLFVYIIPIILDLIYIFVLQQHIAFVCLLSNYFNNLYSIIILLICRHFHCWYIKYVINK